MVRSRCSTPSPVTAEMATEPGLAVHQAGSTSVGPSALLKQQQLGHLAGADLAQDVAHGIDVACGSGAEPSTTWTSRSASAATRNVRLERLDQLVGQLADEPDGVGEQHGLATGQLEPAGGGVEGGEQPVLDQHAGAAQLVEQRGLAGVGVADDGHLAGPAPACAACAGCRGGRSMARRSASSLWIRRVMRRRSVSSWVSPGPRLPTRAPPPPTCRRPAGRGPCPCRAAGAGGSGAGPAPPGPCPPCSTRSGRRCRGSPRCGRGRCGPAASPGCAAGPG